MASARNGDFNRASRYLLNVISSNPFLFHAWWWGRDITDAAPFKRYFDQEPRTTRENDPTSKAGWWREIHTLGYAER
jgi:hypothetical protein